jgi:PhnB protein
MITPYLVFNGDCASAIEFYQTVFKCSEPNIMPYGDYMLEGSLTPPELLRTWVMHGEMQICGTNVWFADEAEQLISGNNVKPTITVPTGSEAKAIFEPLCIDGIVTLPPTETFYSVFHAAVIDKFGINWNIVAEESA